MKKPKSRFEKLKELPVEELAGVLSWYFECSRCPAKREKCSENDATCIDAIRDWLNDDGEF